MAIRTSTGLRRVSWCFEVQGVHFLAANVACEKRKTVRSQPHPGNPGIDQIGESSADRRLFEFAVGDPHAIDRQFLTGASIEVNVFVITRPLEKAYIARCQI